MKKNRTAIIIVLILAVTTTVLVLKNKWSTIQPELKNFEYSDTAAVTKIHLKDKAGKDVMLEKQVDGRWKVNGKFYAQTYLVRSLLGTIHDIRMRNPVGKSARENVVKGLMTGATRIWIYTGDKLVKSYYIGSETQDSEGNYMLLVDPETETNAKDPFVVHIPGFVGYVSGRYFTREQDWRDRTVFHYKWGDIKSVKVDYAVQKDSSFTINVLGENNFEVVDAKGNKLAPVDTAKVKFYLGYFYDVEFEGIENVKQKTKDSTMALGWVHSIAVTDVNGKTNVIRTYRKPPPSPDMTDAKGNPLKEDTDRMYAVMNDNDKEMVLIQYFVFGKLFMPSTHFLKKEKPVIRPGKK
ncbi:MAG TPA: hypothetical protein VI112_04265 [Bacteroidia bacterium]|jgi:hypothetical protein